MNLPTQIKSLIKPFHLILSSVKVRITISMLTMSLIFVIIYILVATHTFEDDKIAYVYETQQNQAHIAARDFASEVVKYYFLGKSIILTYDFNLKNISQQGLALLQENKSILALEMIEDGTDHPFIHLDDKGVLAGVKLVETKELNKLSITYLKQNKFLISSSEMNSQKKVFHIRMIIQNPYQIPKSYEQSFYLIQNGVVLEKYESGNNIESPIPAKLLQNSSESTTEVELKSIKYILSKANVGIDNLSFYIFTPKANVLHATRDLYRKSVVFLIFTTFTTLLLSFLLAHRLTNGIRELTMASNEVAKSNFNFKILFKSKDEIGILASAFREMVLKIQFLIKETAERARMQAELETAKAVQDTLFPKNTRFEKDQLTLVCRYLTASECGGDWLWYWTQNEKLYAIIADATGHGAPAALITSAARSAIATVERSKEMNLTTIAEILNFSLCQCSNGIVYMSGFLIEIDLKTHQVNYINCSHPGTVILPEAQTDTKLNWKELVFLESPVSPQLGKDAEANFLVGTYQLKNKDRILMLTDGLTECVNKAGVAMTERFFYTRLLELNKKTQGKPEVLLSGLYELAMTQSENAPLDDDQTAIIIEYNQKT